MGEIFGWTRPLNHLEFTGERWTGQASGQIEYEHLHRYLLARDLCVGKDVLDIACGEGYGSALLAGKARLVVGADIDCSTVAFAAEAYRAPNLRYIAADARRIPFASGSFDVIVSFETLEHFAEQAIFLAELRRLLRPSGLLIISTPNSEVYSPIGAPANPYHVRELSRAEFEAQLSGLFRHVRILEQRSLIGSVVVSPLAQNGDAPNITYERRDALRFERSPGLPRAVYLIACASDEASAEPFATSLYVHSGRPDELNAQPDDLDAQPDEPDEPAEEDAEAVALHAALAKAHAELAEAAEARARQKGELSAVRALLDKANAELLEAVRTNVLQKGEVERLRTSLTNANLALNKLNAAVTKAEAALSEAVASHAQERAEWDARLHAALRAKEEAEQARIGFEQELSLIQSSTIWQSTYQLRRIASRLPAPVRRALREAIRVAWRAAQTARRHHRSLPVATGSAAAVQVSAEPSATAPSHVGAWAEQSADIVFVSGFPGTPSEAYRVFNPVFILQEAYRVQAITFSEIGSHARLLSGASIIVLYRTPWTFELADIVKQARSNGCLIVFDVDDYVFEPAIVSPDIIDGIRALSKPDLDAYHAGVNAYRKSLEEADYCLFSTEVLAERARELGKTAFVLPNCISPAMLWHYDTALRHRRLRQPERRLRIGYAAGTLTHQRDFGVVYSVLVRLLKERDDWILTIVGHLDITEYPELAAATDRVEVRPAVPHDELPSELARFDINIAPLEVGNPFCEAKSEVKFFNAALVEVPTVASATAPFRAAIRDGVTGFLAHRETEWENALRLLLDDRRLRTRIGLAARSDALRRFGPAALRAKTSLVFEQLRQSPRRKTPARGAGYDHFLYAVNYPPAALQPSVASYTKGLPSGGASDKLNLQWIVPAFSVGWGGVTNIFRIVQQLERFGHRSTLWVHNPPSMLPKGRTVSDYYRELIREHFPAIAADIYPLPHNLDRISGDAVIATDHLSAYPARAVTRVQRRFYFLQDYEPAFHPAGYAALLAEQTYSFGFDALSNGAWLHELAQRHGMWSVKWEQAADPEHYFVDDAEPRQPGHIAFYARAETPRRAVELGYLGFELLAREGLDFHVDLFGGERPPASLPYSFTYHGILSAAELGRLYRRSSIGMVFSATNYSIIPREMMACGLPVVELNSESSRLSFPDGVAELVDPTPESVAGHLRTLLLDGMRRRQLANRALEFLQDFSWEKSAREIERALLFRLGRTTTAEQALEREPINYAVGR